MEYDFPGAIRGNLGRSCGGASADKIFVVAAVEIRNRRMGDLF